MADLDQLQAELNVGVFEDNLLATRLDTQERINSLFSDFNINPIQHTPVVPKDWNTDDILKSQELQIDKFLASPDPRLREIAKQDMLEKDAKNKALTEGFGVPEMVRYQKGQEKFDRDLGFNPHKTLEENEDWYHREVWNRYSTFGKLWRGTGIFVTRALSKMATGLVGMVGDLGSMAWNGLEELIEAGGGPKNNFWADVSDNWLARTMEELNEDLKQEVLPTYKALNYDDKGAFSKLTDSYFWTNDLADGAGFLLQFAIPATLFGRAAQLGRVGKLGRFGKVMSTGVGELNTATKLQKGIGSTLELITGSRNVGGISAHVFNTTMESVAETKEGFKQTVQELMEKGYSQHEAEQIAAENAPTQFGLNMAILTLSNAFENKWFQRFVGNRGRPRSGVDIGGNIKKSPKSWVGKFFANTTTGNRIYFYGGLGAKAAAMEGYWEENAQLAAARVARGEYMRRGDDTLSRGEREHAKGFWKQLLQQTADSSFWGRGDKEAADSIMAGAVIGVLGGSGFARFSGTRGEIKDAEGKVVKSKTFLPEGERRQRMRENAELVARAQNAKDAWLSINVMPTDLYNNDGTLDEEKVKQRVEELNTKLGKVSSILGRKMTIDDLTDQIERERMQHVVFGDYVKAHILNGSADALVNRIKNWKNKSKEELAMYGVTEEAIEDNLYWASVAQDMIDEYKNIDRIHYANNTNETVQGYLQKELALKSLVFDYISHKQSANRMADKYAILKEENNPFKEVNEFNSYNQMIAKRLYYEGILQIPDLSETSKAKYKAELEKVNSLIEMRKKSLPEHQTGTASDFIFNKDSDVEAEEDSIAEVFQDYIQYMFYEEDFRNAAGHYDEMIEHYSDPENGIENYNKAVEKWQEAVRDSETKLKLQNLGYDEAEITDMTEEQKEEIVTNEIKKEKPKEEEEKEKQEKQEKKKDFSLEELEQAIRDIIVRISGDESLIPANLVEGVKHLLDHLSNDPTSHLHEVITPEDIAIMTDYVKRKVEETKAKVIQQTDSESELKTDSEIAGSSAEQAPAPAAQQPSTPENEEKANLGQPAPPPPPTPSSNISSEEREEERQEEQQSRYVPKDLIDKIREEYRRHEKALENESSYKEEADKEDVKIHNNKIDIVVDNDKTEGKITIVTSNPKELKNDGTLKTLDNNNADLARFNFLNKLASNELNEEDFKLRILVSKNGVLYGAVADKEGNILQFDDNANVVKEGVHISMYLDYDTYKPENIDKMRSDVVIPPFAITSLTSYVDPTGKTPRTGDTFFRRPVDLHPSFEGKDVIAMIKNRIKETPVLASIRFVTQGLLYRSGITNSYAKIPKNLPTHTAAELINSGHTRDDKGDVFLYDTISKGAYQRAFRLQFAMLKNLKDPSEGVEMVEFRMKNLGEVVNEDGQNIFDILKTDTGENFFEAAIKGTLPSTQENFTTLTSLLRPDKFLILDLGDRTTSRGTILVVNLKKFKKFVMSDDISVESLRALTTIDDLKNTEINITKVWYDDNIEVELTPGILGMGRDNYSRFIHNNATTSTSPVKKSPNSEGYSRFNRRIVVTLDETIDDMIKYENQKAQIDKSPDVTSIDVKEELSDAEKLKFLTQKEDEEIDLDDDLTNTECK